MPREYKAKRVQNYTNEELASAVDEVKSKTLSLHAAAKKDGVPKSTLHDRLKGTHGIKNGRPNRLSESEENEIVEACLAFSEWGYGLG